MCPRSTIKMIVNIRAFCKFQTFTPLSSSGIRMSNIANLQSYRRCYSSDLTDNELLDIFNTYSAKQLQAMKGIGRVKTGLIMDYRAANGTFENLNQIKQMKGFSSKIIKDLQKPENHMSHHKSSLIDEDLRESLSSIVSIDLGFKNFAYVHMNRDFVILDWHKLSFPSVIAANLQQTYENILGIRQCLPTADVYVIEQASAIPNHGASFNTGIPLRILEALLYCVLQPQKVVSMNARTVQSYFNLSKGRHKKADAVKKVLDLINGQSLYHNVTFTSQQIAEFVNNRKKDDLSDCLLQALTFYDKEVFDHHNNSTCLQEAGSTNSTP